MSISRVAGWIALVLAALIMGVASVRPVVRHMIDRLALANGPWRITLAAGSKDANLYERAAVAVAGLYALAKEETIYYTAFTDDDGRALDARCDYTMSGAPLPARWWSLTMYGADHYLVANTANVYSRHAGNLTLDATGNYTIAVSANAQPDNWLPSPPEGSFSITARLYNPKPEAVADVTKVAMPKIVRGACR